MGAMDDKSPPTTASDVFLERAIEAVLAGKKPEKLETLARGCNTPVSRNSGTVRLALCASTMRSMGRPMRRAHRQAAALPRLPLGMMYEALPPVRAWISRLLAA